MQKLLCILLYCISMINSINAMEKLNSINYLSENNTNSNNKKLLISHKRKRETNNQNTTSLNDVNQINMHRIIHNDDKLTIQDLHKAFKYNSALLKLNQIYLMQNYIIPNDPNLMYQIDSIYNTLDKCKLPKKKFKQIFRDNK
ncbi:MAG: hypothetical protein IJ848_02115 [Alphaproteobacteria bacterium]|nr:hypothetical protein [Alphaproteobacteria bacterium]